MRRILTLVVVFLLLIPTSSWAKKNSPHLEFLSPDDTWLLGFVKHLSPSEFEEGVRQANQLVAMTGKPIGELHRQIYEETGDYYSFVLFIRPTKNLWWTRKSRVVFQLEDGRSFSSEKCLFADSKSQEKVYDTSKQSIVVTRDLMPFGTKGGILLVAKFPKGSFNVNEAKSLTVVDVTSIDQSIKGR